MTFCVRITVLRNVMPRAMTDGWQYFTGIYYLHLAFYSEDGIVCSHLPDFSSLRTSISQHELSLGFMTQISNSSVYDVFTRTCKFSNSFRLPLNRKGLECIAWGLKPTYCMCVFLMILTVNTIISLHSIHRFLRAFAKLLKATISFVMFVRLSAWNKSAHTGQIVMKFVIRVFFANLLRRLKFH